jgi:hypothetical protein
MTPSPASGRRWKPGQSGNPRGRPRVVADVREAARKWTAEAIETLAAIMRDKKAPPAARGAAATALLDRGWGKPVQQIEAENAEPRLVITIKRYDPDSRKHLGDEVHTAETLPAPVRRAMLDRLEEERQRQAAGEVIEGNFKRLPDPN